MTPIAITIAGTDPSGGAGIQADLKTFSALGVYGGSVITALVAQNTTGVTAVHEVPSGFVGQQIDAVFSDLAIKAVKIGMLATPEIIAAVADGLDRWPGAPMVLDPVMVAQSGDPLIADDAVGALRDRLIPRAEIITPNLPEAARLLSAAPAETEAEMAEQGRALLALGPGAVLMKAGHASGAEATDLLVTADGIEQLSARRISTRNTHGTGCTLSSAIAAERAKGAALPQAVANAKAYLTAALAAADDLTIGQGHGPVHHFHALWPALAAKEAAE